MRIILENRCAAGRYEAVTVLARLGAERRRAERLPVVVLARAVAAPSGPSAVVRERAGAVHGLAVREIAGRTESRLAVVAVEGRVGGTAKSNGVNV